MKTHRSKFDSQSDIPSLLIGLMVLFLSVGLMTGTRSVEVSIIFIFSLILTFLFLLARVHDVRYVWYILPFILPSTLAILNYYFIGAYSPDELLFDQIGRDISNSLHSKNTPNPGWYNIRVNSYALIVGIIYFIFTDELVVISLINAGIWSLAAILWISIAKNNIDSKSDSYMSIILSFSPALWLFMSSNLREAITMLIFSLFMWSLLRYVSDQSVISLLKILFIISFLAIFRPELAILCLIALIIINNKDIRTTIITVVSFLTMIYTLPSNLNPLNLQTLERIRQSRDGSLGGAYLIGSGYDSWLDVLLSLPFRTFYFLFSPLPWNLGNYSTYIMTFDSLYILTLFGIVVIGISYVRLLPKRVLLVLILLLFIILLGYSTILTASAAVPRRRMFVTPIFALFASAYLANRVEVRL